MQRGRGGRRIQPQVWSTGCTPPWWTPYYFRFSLVSATYAGIPLAGPLGDPFRAPIWVAPTVAKWETHWTEPITGRAYTARFFAAPRLAAGPGMRLGVTLKDDGSGSLCFGQFTVPEPADRWQTQSLSIPWEYSYLCNTFQGLWFPFAQLTTEAAHWHRMPA